MISIGGIHAVVDLEDRDFDHVGRFDRPADRVREIPALARLEAARFPPEAHQFVELGGFHRAHDRIPIHVLVLRDGFGPWRGIVIGLGLLDPAVVIDLRALTEHFG